MNLLKLFNRSCKNQRERNRLAKTREEREEEQKEQEEGKKELFQNECRERPFLTLSLENLDRQTCMQNPRQWKKRKDFAEHEEKQRHFNCSGNQIAMQTWKTFRNVRKKEIAVQKSPWRVAF